MTRFAAPFALLILAGCASDTTLQLVPAGGPIQEGTPQVGSPVTGPENPVRPDPPGGGGPWGT
jgi:hypothetical protein